MKGWTSRSGLILDRDWGQGFIERENVSSGLNLKGPEIEKISDSLHALREALLSLVWQVSASVWMSSLGLRPRLDNLQTLADTCQTSERKVSLAAWKVRLLFFQLLDF